MKAKYISPEFKVVGMHTTLMEEVPFQQGSKRPNTGQAKSSGGVSFFDDWDEDDETDDASTNW